MVWCVGGGGGQVCSRGLRGDLECKWGFFTFKPPPPGWFGFNAGSAVSVGANAVTTSSIAVRAFVNTHLAAAIAMVTWIVLEVAVPEKSAWGTGRPSAVGAACGAVCGLVASAWRCWVEWRCMGEQMVWVRC